MRTARRVLAGGWGIAWLAAEGAARAQGEALLPNAQPGYTPHRPPIVELVATEPVEEPAPAFGARGEFVVTGRSDVHARSTSYDATQDGELALLFSAGLDYFVARGLSLGVTATASYSDQTQVLDDRSTSRTRTTDFALGARLGVNLPLGRALSWYPRLAVGVDSTHVRTSVAGADGAPLPGVSTPVELDLFASLDAPLLVHAVPHFFFGAGPTVFHKTGPTSTYASGQQTSVGGSFLVGGYWGGELPEEREPAPAANAPPQRRFGDDGELVLTNETSLGGVYVTYEGTKASYGQVSVAPSLDYFVGYRVSVGAFVVLEYFGGASPASAPAKYTASALGAGLRVGYDFPFTRWLSLYPRVGMAYVSGAASGNDVGAGTSTGKATTFQLYAPLLVHPVQHLFVGFGPELVADLSHTYEPGAPNAATTLGAALLVGGWL